MKGWNENIYNHLPAKVHKEDGTESFLINPFRLRYGEITASSLIRVGADGKIKHTGVTNDLFGINDAGFVIHCAIHRARPDLQSVMHCHHPSAAGVFSVRQGFLELAQTATRSARLPITTTMASSSTGGSRRAWWRIWETRMFCSCATTGWSPRESRSVLPGI